MSLSSCLIFLSTSPTFPPSALWRPNIIWDNGILTESLHCALDTHNSANRGAHIRFLNGNQCAYNARGHKENAMECM